LKRALFIRLWFTSLLGLLSLGAPEFSAVMASPKDLAPAIAPEARKEIRIAVSVRPTMRVQQIPMASKTGDPGNDLLFCVWSNSPAGRYDVGVELEGSAPDSGSVFPAKLQWGGNGPVAGNDGLLWIRDQRASGHDPACSTRESAFTAMAASNGKRGAPVSGVITVLIAPQ
jgi:hypothetical protein